MLILASSSPRRRQLLSLLGLDFQVITSDIDENVIPGESPRDYVMRLAIDKSRSVASLTNSERMVIAADTAVVFGNQILGKPVNKDEAFTMLRDLRAGSHHVLTGIAVWDPDNHSVIMDNCDTEVQMRSYQESEMEAYIASGDPMDKAGAYAIQNSRFNPVRKIHGCYTNVVGLPLCHLTEILEKLEIDVPQFTTQGCRTENGYSCQLIDQVQAFN